jgi:hypothetical protein
MKRNREAKVYTPEQVEAKQDKAVRFLRDVVGDDDRADDIEDMSLSEYAEHKRIQMGSENPRKRRETRGKRRKRRNQAASLLQSFAPTGIFTADADVLKEGRKSKRKKKNSGAERCKQYRDRCVPMRSFAFVGDPGRSTTYKLRLDDASHVRAAMARFSHTRIPAKYRRRVAQEIVSAAKRFGIDPSGFERRHVKRNPNGDAAGAAAMYKTFHGRDPREVLEYESALPYGDLAALGDLIELDLPDIGKTIGFERDGVVLAANPEGTQLFAVGGDQDLSKAAELADDPTKEFIDFGPIESVTYRTRKGFDRFQTTDYVHQLGEEGGEKPRLIYHVPTQHMIFAGGQYRVEAPGIIN